MCVYSCIGMAPPPLGVNLFVAVGLRQTKVETAVNKYLAIYIISGLIILLLITYVPDIVRLLPHSAKNQNKLNTQGDR